MSLEAQLGIDSESTPANLYWEKVDSYITSLFQSDLKDTDNNLLTKKVCDVYSETNFDYEENELSEEEYSLLIEKTESQYFVHGRETDDCDLFTPTTAYTYILKYYHNVIQVRNGAQEKSPYELFAFYNFDNYHLFMEYLNVWKQDKISMAISNMIGDFIMANLIDVIKLFDIELISKEFFESYGHYTYESIEAVKSSLLEPTQESIIPSLSSYLSEKLRSDFPDMLPVKLGSNPKKLSNSSLINKWRQSGSCIIKPEDAFACGYSNYSEFVQALNESIHNNSKSDMLRECFEIGVNKGPSEEWTDLIDLYAFERKCEASFSEIEEESEDDLDNYVFLANKSDSDISSIILDFFDQNYALILENLNFLDLHIDNEWDQFQELYKNFTAAQIKALMIIQCKGMIDDGHILSIEIPEDMHVLLNNSSKDIPERTY